MKLQAHPRHNASTRRLTAAILTTMTLFATSLFATSLSASDGGILTVTPSAVTFETPAVYDSLSLIVGGPDGRVHRETLEGTQSLSFGGFDDKGGRRPDGLYSYQLSGRVAIVESETRATDEEEAPEVREILLDSGFFTIDAGAFVSPDLPEGEDFQKLTLNGQDLVVNSGDLIVKRSGCFGYDCDTSVNFGVFDIKLRETNTRLMFDDTSSTIGVFPHNDWALIANDTNSGGASKFSIQDCGSANNDCATATNPFTVMSGAPESALFVDSQGDVGLGTAAPVVDIHAVDGNTPALRLEQDGSSGFTAQTWDVAGNEYSFFIRDVTSGSAHPFRIRAGAPNDALFIDADGAIGLGTNNPGAHLDVQGDVVLTGTVDGRDIATDGATLDAHLADSGNPHGVIAAQIGAEPAGTAASAVAAHEAAYDHAGLGSDHLKAGIAYAIEFTGTPATAVVDFATPFPAGTAYALSVTVVTIDDTQTLVANPRTTSEAGFKIFLDGDTSNLAHVDWIARRVTQ